MSVKAVMGENQNLLLLLESISLKFIFYHTDRMFKSNSLNLLCDSDIDIWKLLLLKQIDKFIRLFNIIKYYQYVNTWPTL